MKCREVKKGLVAYLDGEVMPSERTLIEAHLAACTSCDRELSALASTRRLVAGSLRSVAAQAAPSPLALGNLQARLVEEARANRKQGDRRMKMRWKVVLGTAGAVVLAVCIIAAVPATRAAAGDFFAHVFSIDASKLVKFEYLPEGFDSQPVHHRLSGARRGTGHFTT